MTKLNRTTSAEGQELSLSKKDETIKLGIDWHASYYKVARIIDEAAPEHQPQSAGRVRLKILRR